MERRRTYYDDGVEIVLAGVVTSEDVIKISAEVYRHPNMKNFRFQLWFMEDVEEFLISPEQMRDVVRQDLTVARTYPDMKVAIVANSSLVYGMARMYEALCDGSGWETMVFHNIDEAWQWVAASTDSASIL